MHCREWTSHVSVHANLKVPNDELIAHVPYKKTSDVLDLTYSLGLTQLVSFPTRIGSKGRHSMLDLVFCNEPNIVKNLRSGPGLASSDHFSVLFDLDVHHNHQELSRYFHQFHHTRGRYFSCCPAQEFCCSRILHF